MPNLVSELVCSNIRSNQSLVDVAGNHSKIGIVSAWDRLGCRWADHQNIEETARRVGRKMANGNVLLQTGRIMTSDQYERLKERVWTYVV